MADKNSAQTNIHTDRQTNRHYENNCHLAVNQYVMHFTAKAILTGHRIHTTLTDQAAVNIPLDVQYVIFETID